MLFESSFDWQIYRVFVKKSFDDLFCNICLQFSPNVRVNKCACKFHCCPQCHRKYSRMIWNRLKRVEEYYDSRHFPVCSQPERQERSEIIKCPQRCPIWEVMYGDEEREKKMNENLFLLCKICNSSIFSFGERFKHEYEQKHESCCLCDGFLGLPCSSCSDYNKETTCKGAEIRCGHKYHAHCLEEWIKCRVVCPLCNEEIHDYRFFDYNLKK